MESASTHAPAVEGELRTSVQRVRGALTDLFQSVGADPSTPQEVARTVGINRNLAWKLSKVIGAEEPLAVVEHLPGDAGLDIMLKAFRRAGAPQAATDRVRKAMESFQRAIEQHADDRTTLELMLGPMLPRHLRTERAEAARKLAFQGNSAIWGIQARVRLSTMLVAPNAGDPTMVDIANVGGLIGYRRLRPGITWPLLRLHGYEDDGRAFEARREGLDPQLEPGAAPLLKAFCTGAQPPIIPREIPGGMQFELGPGPLGNQGLITSVFGTFSRCFASCYRDEKNEHGEQLVNWFTPVTTAVTDLIVHRALPFRMPPTFSVVGRMTPSWGDSVTRRDREQIELPERIQHLGEGPPVLSTPLIPDYTAMVAFAFERLDWDPRDFTAYRVVVRYPPTPTMAILSFPLAERPEQGRDPAMAISTDHKQGDQS